MLKNTVIEIKKKPKKTYFAAFLCLFFNSVVFIPTAQLEDNIYSKDYILDHSINLNGHHIGKEATETRGSIIITGSSKTTENEKSRNN